MEGLTIWLVRALILDFKLTVHGRSYIRIHIYMLISPALKSALSFLILSIHSMVF
jgi:hypothetical protein